MQTGKPLIGLILIAISFICQLLWGRGSYPTTLGFAVALYLLIALEIFSDHPQDFFDADKIFLAVAGYYLIVPTVLVSLGFQQYPLLESGLLINNRAALWTTIAALVGLAIGFRTRSAALVIPRIPALRNAWEPRSVRLIAYALIAIGSSLFVMLVVKVGLSTYLQGDYVSTYSSERGEGYLSAGLFIVEIGTVLLLAESAQSNKRPVAVAIVFSMMALFFLRIGRRRPLLEEALALASVYHFSVRRFRLRSLAITGIAGLALFGLVGQARAYMGEGLPGITRYLTEDFRPAELWTFLDESQAIPRSINETVDAVPAQEAYALGRTYLSALPAMVPLKLFPERPLSPSEYFIQKLAPDQAAAGGGFSFSHMAEAYLNFGLFGVAIFYFVIGSLLRAMVMVRREHPAIGHTFLHAVLLMACVGLVRGDSHGLLKVIVICTWIPALACALFLEKRHSIVGRRAASA